MLVRITYIRSSVDGKMGSKLVGIVTNRDVDFLADRSTKIADIMTTDLVTAPEGSFPSYSVSTIALTAFSRHLSGRMLPDAQESKESKAAHRE